MSYRVTYTVNTEPTDLPDGATVEQISALPVLIGKDSITPFTLEKSEVVDRVAFFDIDGVHKHLTREQTAQVRDALNELLGESSVIAAWDGYREPPTGINHTRDREGDDWYRLADGTWSMDRHRTHAAPWSEDAASYTPHRLP